MSRCQSVAIEVNSSALTGLFGANGPGECQKGGGDGGGVVGGGMDGAVRWGLVRKREGEWAGGGWGGVGWVWRCVWRRPLGPRNWHVQARGREAGALIRHVTAQPHFLKPQTTALVSAFLLK